MIKGVNLGGWLVLERWITPTLFSGLKATDETQLCLELGHKASYILQSHWQNYITESDFEWIAKNGLNAIRIPVAYWIFNNTPLYRSSLEYLDFAMMLAEKYNLFVVIDLHAAPGSQNGWDHSGKSGEVEWHRYARYQEESLEVVEKLAERYKGSPHLWGIELLNEPRWDIPHQILVDYYKLGYERVRKHCPDRVAVIIHDAFRFTDWEGSFPSHDYRNLVLDTHCYQCFSDEDKRLNPSQHITKVQEIGRALGQMAKCLPVIVGEWSLGLDPLSLRGLDDQEKQFVYKQYAQEQVATYGQTRGWFFWNYKTEDMALWSFRECVKRGWLTLG